MAQVNIDNFGATTADIPSVQPNIFKNFDQNHPDPVDAFEPKKVILSEETLVIPPPRPKFTREDNVPELDISEGLREQATVIKSMTDLGQLLTIEGCLARGNKEGAKYYAQLGTDVAKNEPVKPTLQLVKGIDAAGNSVESFQPMKTPQDEMAELLKQLVASSTATQNYMQQLLAAQKSTYASSIAPTLVAPTVKDERFQLENFPSPSPVPTLQTFNPNATDLHDKLDYVFFLQREGLETSGSAEEDK